MVIDIPNQPQKRIFQERGMVRAYRVWIDVNREGRGRAQRHPGAIRAHYISLPFWGVALDPQNADPVWKGWRVARSEHPGWQAQLSLNYHIPEDKAQHPAHRVYGAYIRATTMQLQQDSNPLSPNASSISSIYCVGNSPQLIGNEWFRTSYH